MISMATTTQEVPDIAAAFHRLRLRVDRIASGEAPGRFWTTQDLDDADAILGHLDSRATFDQVVATVERAAAALTALIDGGKRIAPPSDPEKDAMRRAIERYLGYFSNCDFIDGEPDVCPGIASGDGQCYWCELRAAVGWGKP